MNSSVSISLLISTVEMRAFYLLKCVYKYLEVWFLTREILTPGDIWQCLEIFVVVTLEEVLC